MPTTIDKTRVIDKPVELTGDFTNGIGQRFAPAFRVVKNGVLTLKGTTHLQKEWAEGTEFVSNMAVQVDGGKLIAHNIHLREGYGVHVLRGTAEIHGGDAKGLQKYAVYLGDENQNAWADNVLVENFECLDGSTKESTIRSQGCIKLILKRCRITASTKHGKGSLALRLCDRVVIEGGEYRGLLELGWRIPAAVGEFDRRAGHGTGNIAMTGCVVRGQVGVNGDYRLAAAGLDISPDPRGSSGWGLIEQTHATPDGRKYTGVIVEDSTILTPGLKNSSGVQTKAQAEQLWRDIWSAANAG